MKHAIITLQKPITSATKGHEIKQVPFQSANNIYTAARFPSFLPAGEKKNHSQAFTDQPAATIAATRTGACHPRPTKSCTKSFRILYKLSLSLAQATTREVRHDLVYTGRLTAQKNYRRWYTPARGVGGQALEYNEPSHTRCQGRPGAVTAARTAGRKEHRRKNAFLEAYVRPARRSEVRHAGQGIKGGASKYVAMKPPRRLQNSSHHAGACQGRGAHAARPCHQ